MKYNFIYLLIGIIVFTSLIAAWPYQLNITDGVIYDLNVSNNETTNFTLIVVYTNITYNNTYNNTYNITYLNKTCYNCSEYITYNYTLDIDDLNTSYYNLSQVDGKFLTLSEFTAYKTALVFPYPSKNEFNDLALRVNNTEAELDKGYSNSGIWVVSILSLLVGCAAIFLIFKLASGYDA